MPAALTWDLAIALDLAALAFIAVSERTVSQAAHISARGDKSDAGRMSSCRSMRASCLKHRSTGIGSTGESGHISPGNGDVSIPLCARVGSVALFRLPLGRLGGRSRSRITRASLRRCPVHARGFGRHDTGRTRGQTRTAGEKWRRRSAEKFLAGFPQIR